VESTSRFPSGVTVLSVNGVIVQNSDLSSIYFFFWTTPVDPLPWN